ncbi:hypothetical protein JXVLWARM_CDS_0102 [Burkholderia phage Bm1]
MNIRSMLEQAMKPTALSLLVDFNGMRELLFKIALAGSNGWGTIEGHARVATKEALRKKTRGLVMHDRYLNSVEYDRTSPWPYRPRKWPTASVMAAVHMDSYRHQHVNRRAVVRKDGF